MPADGVAYRYTGYPIKYELLLFRRTFDFVKEVEIVQVKEPEERGFARKPGVFADDAFTEEFKGGVA